MPAACSLTLVILSCSSHMRRTVPCLHALPAGREVASTGPTARARAPHRVPRPAPAPRTGPIHAAASMQAGRDDVSRAGPCRGVLAV